MFGQLEGRDHFVALAAEDHVLQVLGVFSLVLARHCTARAGLGIS